VPKIVSTFEYSLQAHHAHGGWVILPYIVGPGAAKVEASPRAGATRRVIDGLRELIVRRELGAGQQVHQEQLAQLLGVSRIPVREALKALEAEGLLSHAPNRGYFVTVVRAEELRQIYLMRRLIEAEALKAVVWPDAGAIHRLRQINANMAEAARSGAINPMVGLNREFHFAIFELSQLRTVVQEIERLWRISEQYRVFYLSEATARRRVVREHEMMIAALEAHDRARLMAVAHRHRKAAEDRLTALLGGTDA
jgi:DNA-binding GntR family transcriptional regulator